jgi:hypothetical protein
MKVYKVTCCNGSTSLVVAKSFGEAEDRFIKKHRLFSIESIEILDYEVI